MNILHGKMREKTVELSSDSYLNKKTVSGWATHSLFRLERVGTACRRTKSDHFSCFIIINH